jgi:hypothetical protein
MNENMKEIINNKTGSFGYFVEEYKSLKNNKIYCVVLTFTNGKNTLIG